MFLSSLYLLSKMCDGLGGGLRSLSALLVVYLFVIIVILNYDCFSLITKHPSQFQIQWPFWVRHCPYAPPGMISGPVLAYTFRKSKVIYMCFF